MGLDVTLYRLPGLDTHKVALYSEKSNRIWIRAQHGKKVSLTEQEQTELSRQCSELAARMALPLDIEELIHQQKAEISLPSVKYPGMYQIGYWNSGYGGGGIDTVLKATVGRGLYDAFPEAKRRGYYIKPNWERSHRTLQSILRSFQAKGHNDGRFVKVTNYTRELGQNAATLFFKHTEPITPNGQQFFDDFQENLSAPSLFTDYVKELEVIIETVEYVLAQPDKDRFLLSWGA